MNKFVDIKEDFVNYDRWNGELPFRGVLACKCESGGKYQPLKWCPPQSYGWGDDNVYNRSLAKDYHNCFFHSSSRNSLASNEGGHLSKIKFLFGSQKQLVWASSLLLLKPLLFNF